MAILIEAVLAPVDVGLNLTIKIVLALAVIGDVGCVCRLNSLALVPAIVTGVVIVRSDVPVFSMVNTTSVFVPNTLLPKSYTPPLAIAVVDCFKSISGAVVPVPCMLKL